MSTRPAHEPSAPVADDERLRALRLLRLLDTPPEEGFDRLTRLAGRLLGVPVSLVSLVDEDRQFFKSQQGLPEPWASRRETPLSHSFCQHVVASAEPLVVPDARLHPQLRDNGAVRDIGVIAYAGMPLTTAEGHTLGSFCAIDTEPRQWSADDLDVLRTIAASAVTELELRRALEQTALRDPVTGLPARALFLEHVQRALLQREEQRGSLVVLKAGLDGFRRVNDAYGNAGGDQVLAAVGARLDEHLRAADVLARLHGDRFGLLLTDVRDPRDILSTAQRVLACFDEAFEVGGHDVRVSATVGVAVAARGERDAAELVARADRALHRGKERGGSQVSFPDHAGQRRASRQLELQSQLGRALEREELHLVFQPIVELASPNRVVDVEALLRWRSPGLGVVSPAEFIPVAESSGLILPIGAWVLREACRQAARWSRAAGHPVAVSANVSAEQVTDAAFLTTVEAALEDAGLPAGQLALEVTESVLLDDGASVDAVLRRLCELGVGLVLDDFGTGFSSLSLLKRAPLSGVKIDRQFVAGLPGDRQDRAICEAIIHMSRALGLQVVAEGVETPAQAEALEGLGADHAQGFLFGRPAAPEPVLAGTGRGAVRVRR